MLAAPRFVHHEVLHDVGLPCGAGECGRLLRSRCAREQRREENAESSENFHCTFIETVEQRVERNFSMSADLLEVGSGCCADVLHERFVGAGERQCDASARENAVINLLYFLF
jgi:hypothetical protein